MNRQSKPLLPPESATCFPAAVILPCTQQFHGTHSCFPSWTLVSFQAPWAELCLASFTCCFAFPDAVVCMQVQKHCWDSSLLSLRQRPLGSALSHCRNLVRIKNVEPLTEVSTFTPWLVKMTIYKNIWGVSKGLWWSLLAAAWAGSDEQI